MRRFSGMSIAMTALLVLSVRAQSPDGRPVTNPPRPAPKIDRARIAILPARTSGADSTLRYLSNGLVDLLAPQFTGEAGPLAIEPADAVTAWSRYASGHTAATKADAIRVAQLLGAGQVAYSTVVGTPRRFTVTTTILNVPDGSVRVPPVQIDGTADSLASVAATLSARLMGRSAGAWRLSSNDPGTTSNDALRAYLDGMAAFRHGSRGIAVVLFDRATTLDSTFGLAGYRRAVLTAMLGPSAPFPQFRHAWRERNRLSADQRRLLEAIADTNGMLYRAQALPRLERAIDAVAMSAEAWEILGDLYFHIGAAIGRTDWAARSRAALLRAIQLDTAACRCHTGRQHLVDLAYLDGDAPAIERYAMGGSRAEKERYLAALVRGNGMTSRKSRSEFAATITELATPDWLGGVTLPHAELDSLLVALQAYTNDDSQRQALEGSMAAAREFEGRPAGAESVRSPSRDATAADVARLGTAELDSAALMRLSNNARFPDSTTESCNVALAKLRHGDTTSADAALRALPVWRLGAPSAEFRNFSNEQRRLDQSPQRRQLTQRLIAMLCREMLAGVLGSFEPAGSAALVRADSIVRVMPLNIGDAWNYDLSLAFARRGEYRAALDAVRRRWFTPGAVPRLVISLRQEGKWAAIVGDTAGAIKAYRHYLLWRDDPEPVLIPQRDSVRGELAALEKPNARRVVRRPP